MSENGQCHGDSLPLPAVERIDQQCLKFEAAWLAGEPLPLDENLLGETQGVERRQLLRELLLLEVDYRLRHDDPPQQAEYETKFPGDTQIIGDVFSQLHQIEQTTDPEIGLNHSSDGDHPARFRHLRAHAQGGLGEIFIAYDHDLKREVALKEIKAQHADNWIRRDRFIREAEITGGLEHPGIVPVHALGIRPDGRPYYVMRFINGKSLQEALEQFHQSSSKSNRMERSIAFRKLLRRFVDVCHTIDYAHNRGVVHRDLKPANIMLGEFGETLVVDWGLAESTDQSSEEEISDAADTTEPETPAAPPIGTPAFMSPELAAGLPLGFDPASDIYCLGATFYTLLTGRPPFAGADMDQVLDRVKRGDFPPPRSVNRHIPAPLEAICLKAMARNPQDRYASAGEMADEIEAWKADEPVTAYREPIAAWTARWVRVHQKIVMATVVAVVVGIVSLAAGIGLLATKNRELQAAQQSELSARLSSQRRFDLAMEAIGTYYTGVNESLLFADPRLDDLRNRMLQEPLQFYKQLSVELRGDQSIESRASLADAYYAIGAINQMIGDNRVALDALEPSLQLRRQLIDEQPDNRQHLEKLVTALTLAGTLEHARGDLDRAEQRNEEALDFIDQVMPAFQRWHALESKQAKLLHNQAILLFERGKMEEAYSSCEQALRIQSFLVEEIPDDESLKNDLGKHHHIAGNLLRQLDRDDEARTHYTQALEIHQELVAQFPNQPEYKKELAGDLNNMALFEHTREQGVQSAKQGYDAAIEIYEELLKRYPYVAELQSELARTYVNRFFLVVDSPQFDGSDVDPGDADRAMELLSSLSDAHPQILDYRRRLANLHREIGLRQRGSGQLADAVDSFRQSIATFESLASGPGGAADDRHELGKLQRTLAAMLGAVQPDESPAEFQQAIELHQALVQEFPDRAEYQEELARHYQSFAYLFMSRNQLDEAQQTLQRAVELGERVMAGESVSDDFVVEHGGSLCNLGILQRKQGDRDEALESFNSAIATLSPVVERDPSNTVAAQFLKNAKTEHERIE